MKQRTKQLVVTFHTTAASMAMEKACLTAGLPGRLAPVPRQLTADCGIAWRAAVETRAALEALIRENNLETSGIFELEI